MCEASILVEHTRYMSLCWAWAPADDHCAAADSNVTVCMTAAVKALLIIATPSAEGSCIALSMLPGKAP